MASATEKNVILQRWHATLALRATDPAVLDLTGSVVRTFADIASEAAQWQRAFAGAHPGEVVALQLGNHPEWPAVLVACLESKLVPLPLGQMPVAERNRILAGLGISLMVVTSDHGPVVQRRARHARESSTASVPLQAGTQALKLTSGTTGAPRAIEFTSEQLLADCDNICATMGMSADDLNFGVIPLSHSYGFSNLVTPLLCCGVPMVISADRMPRAILAGLAKTRATVFPGMPVFYQALVELGGNALPDLRLCISAGAPLQPRLAERFQAVFGKKIHTFYGSSECGGIAYDRTGDAALETGCVGTPMKNVMIQSAPDQRIEVHSDAVATGYYPDPDLDILGLRRFVPGDLVQIAGDRLQIVGRVSDVINVAGRKLNPAEVETELLKYTGVRQAVVFGVPSTIRGEEAVACVAGEVSGAELMRFAQERLSPWQVPKDYWIVPEVPVNERGKTSRGELARLYLERGRGVRR